MAPTPIEIPSSDSCVDVKIIDTTAYMKLPLALFTNPIKVGDYEFLEGADFSFLIENPRTNQRVIFDMGVRKDWENYAPALTGMIKAIGGAIDIKKNVVEIIQEHGVSPSSINSLIWSHPHFDHMGDPSTFPSTAELVVGPGFKKAFLPGYPKNPEGAILESDYSGRELREISFEPEGGAKPLKIGDFEAYDFFGDGSFYLLNSPGHAIGHMCAIVRTTPNTFILLGGDICHHGGVMRPTQFLPLPENISPNPLDHASLHACPCSIFVNVHPKKSRTEPFFTVASSEGGMSAFHDSHEAMISLDKLKPFDADDRFFVAIAHDGSLRGVVDQIPQSLNQWSEKGWKEKARWRFLADFKKSA